MLLADFPPKDIIICKAFPFLAYLSSPAERSGVEVGEDPEGDFVGENREGVYSNDIGELVDEQRELRETAHGQQTLEDQGTPRMG